MRSTARLAAAALTALALSVSVPAHAGDDDEDDTEVIRTGSCTSGSDWKIKVKPDDGRLEVEAEIDSSRAGQSWRWVLRHGNGVSARGTSQTTARSGSFEVERKTVDMAGTDSFRFRAVHAGEVCVARVSY